MSKMSVHMNDLQRKRVREAMIFGGIGILLCVIAAAFFVVRAFGFGALLAAFGVVLATIARSIIRRDSGHTFAKIWTAMKPYGS